MVDTEHAVARLQLRGLVIASTTSLITRKDIIQDHPTHSNGAITATNPTIVTTIVGFAPDKQQSLGTHLNTLSEDFCKADKGDYVSDINDVYNSNVSNFYDHNAVFNDVNNINFRNINE